MPAFFTDQPFTLKIIMVLIAGIGLLRFAGKRSISQLTVPEVVLIIALGTLLIQPTSTKNEFLAIYGGVVLVSGMVLLSYLQIKFPALRKWIVGKPAVLIENGEINMEKLKRARMNMDELEMRLRSLKVTNTADVNMAVLEFSGELSVVLNEEKKAAEKADIQKIMDQLQSMQHELTIIKKLRMVPSSETHSATEVTSPKKIPLFEEARTEESGTSTLLN